MVKRKNGQKQPFYVVCTGALAVERKSRPLMSTSHIPVIMISASPDIAKLSKEAGADGCIEKPFEFKNLSQVVNFHSCHSLEAANQK